MRSVPPLVLTAAILACVTLAAGPLVAQFSLVAPVRLTPETVDTANLADYERAHARQPRSYPRAYALALAYARTGRPAEVARTLEPFLGWTVTNSSFYEVLAQAQLALGRDADAEATVAAGLGHYPYARALQRMSASFAAERGRWRTPEEAFASDLPAGAALEVASQLAFDADDVVNGLLYAETAALDDADLGLASAGGLSPKLAARVRDAYAALADSSLAPTAYAPGSFEAAYLGALYAAAARARALGIAYPSALERAATLRVAALRLFAADGHLARFRHPLLDDLWVLERRGYLDWVALAALRELDPGRYRALTTARPEYAAEVEAYLQTRWAADIRVYLGEVGEG